MKTHLPESIVAPGHPDFDLLSRIAEDLALRAGGLSQLGEKLALMFRGCIDGIIDTPKTGRRSYDELEKTEKTYIGTRVEIELRAMLDLPRGKRLDCAILGHEIDIKHTMGSDWMIPTEAIDHPCILLAADETALLCYLGLVWCRPSYLRTSQNRDNKTQLHAKAYENILWLVLRQSYPSNFWRDVPQSSIDCIFAGKSGNQRVISLFREIQARPVGRDVIASVARQLDFTRRLRADGESGTRNILSAEGIVLLSGDYHSILICDLGLPFCKSGEWISFRPTDSAQLALCRDAGFASLPPISGGI